VLGQGVEGIATAPRDSHALATALRMLLLNPDLRARMGGRGIETARRHAWPGIVSRLEEIYASLAGGGARAEAGPGGEASGPEDRRRRDTDTLLPAGA
jgi:hypothetical protein